MYLSASVWSIVFLVLLDLRWEIVVLWSVLPMGGFFFPFTKLYHNFRGCVECFDVMAVSFRSGVNSVVHGVARVEDCIFPSWECLPFLMYYFIFLSMELS